MRTSMVPILLVVLAITGASAQAVIAAWVWDNAAHGSLDVNGTKTSPTVLANGGALAGSASLTGHHAFNSRWIYTNRDTYDAVTSQQLTWTFPPGTKTRAPTLASIARNWWVAGDPGVPQDNYWEITLDVKDYQNIAWIVTTDSADVNPTTGNFGPSGYGSSVVCGGVTYPLTTWTLPGQRATSADGTLPPECNRAGTIKFRVFQDAAAQGGSRGLLYGILFTGTKNDSAPDCTVDPNAAGCGDPHLQGFNGHTYAFCEENDGAHCKGLTFNMLTSSAYVINTQLNRHAGPNAWPHAGTWMTGFGFRYADLINMEVALNTNVDWEVVADEARGGDHTRAAPVEGGFKKLLSSVRLNGKDAMAELESGHTIEMGDAMVFFPATKHEHDPTSGPIAIIRTPDLEFAMFLEAGDIWHLDMQLKVVGHGVSKMHGLLGQSFHWAKSDQAVIEGGEMAYVIKDGLSGHAFAYDMFTGKPESAGSSLRRALLIFDQSMIGKTAGATTGVSGMAN